MTHRTKCSSGQEPHAERNSKGTEYSGKRGTLPFLCRKCLPMLKLPPDTGSPARTRDLSKILGISFEGKKGNYRLESLKKKQQSGRGVVRFTLQKRLHNQSGNNPFPPHVFHSSPGEL